MIKDGGGQLAIDGNNSKVFSRRLANGTFTNWSRLLSTNEIANNSEIQNICNQYL